MNLEQTSVPLFIPPNAPAWVKGRFGRHQMTAIFDPISERGEPQLYRHLRFMRPDTWGYAFDIVTWPGHLVLEGDIGSYHFARMEDMIAFFLSSVNPHYWSEKLRSSLGTHGGDLAVEYSLERLRQTLISHFTEDDWYYHEQPHDRVYESLVVDAVDGLLRGHDPGFWYENVATEDGAAALLNQLAKEELVPDEWYMDWDLRDFRHDFLQACWAVHCAAVTYRRAGDAE